MRSPVPHAPGDAAMAPAIRPSRHAANPPCSPTARRARIGGVLALATLAFTATMVATRHGPEVGPDSVAYISAARNLGAGAGLTDFTGDALTVWPPGLPAMLSLAHGVGLGFETASRLLNAAALAATVVLTYRLMVRHVRSGALALVGTAFVAASPALLRVADVVWSEALFCAVVLAFLVVLEWALVESRRPIVAVAVLAVTAWAAFLVRYPGAALIPAGAAALVCGASEQPRRTRAARAALFSAASLVVPVLWVVRNATSGAPDVLGFRVPAGLHVADLLGRGSRALGYLFVPGRAGHVVAMAVGGLLAAIAVGSAVTVATRVGAHGVRGQPPPWARALLPTVLVVVSLAGTAAAAHPLTGSDLSARVLAPVLAPLVVVGCTGLQAALDALGVRGRRSTTRVIAAGAGAVLVAQGAFLVTTALDHGHAARGYAAPRWRQSALLRAAEAVDPERPLYSNSPWPIAYLADRTVVRLAPREAAPGLSHRPASTCELAASARRGGVLVWWHERGTGSLRRLREAVAPVELVASVITGDGTLYRLELPVNTGLDQRCR